MKGKGMSEKCKIDLLKRKLKVERGLLKKAEKENERLRVRIEHDFEVMVKDYKFQLTIEEENANLEEENEELKDFCIWMTGCGYDFASLPYFCEQRDKLLKKEGYDERKRDE